MENILKDKRETLERLLDYNEIDLLDNMSDEEIENRIKNMELSLEEEKTELLKIANSIDELNVDKHVEALHSLEEINNLITEKRKSIDEISIEDIVLKVKSTLKEINIEESEVVLESYSNVDKSIALESIVSTIKKVIAFIINVIKKVIYAVIYFIRKIRKIIFGTILVGIAIQIYYFIRLIRKIREENKRIDKNKDDLKSDTTSLETLKDIEEKIRNLDPRDEETIKNLEEKIKQLSQKESVALREKIKSLNESVQIDEKGKIVSFAFTDLRKAVMETISDIVKKIGTSVDSFDNMYENTKTNVIQLINTIDKEGSLILKFIEKLDELKYEILLVEKYNKKEIEDIIHANLYKNGIFLTLLYESKDDIIKYLLNDELTEDENDKYSKRIMDRISNSLKRNKFGVTDFEISSASLLSLPVVEILLDSLNKIDSYLDESTVTLSDEILRKMKLTYKNHKLMNIFYGKSKNKKEYTIDVDRLTLLRERLKGKENIDESLKVYKTLRSRDLRFAHIIKSIESILHKLSVISAKSQDIKNIAHSINSNQRADSLLRNIIFYFDDEDAHHFYTLRDIIKEKAKKVKKEDEILKELNIKDHNIYDDDYMKNLILSFKDRISGEFADIATRKGENYDKALNSIKDPNERKQISKLINRIDDLIEKIRAYFYSVNDALDKSFTNVFIRFPVVIYLVSFDMIAFSFKLILSMFNSIKEEMMSIAKSSS